MAIIGSLFFSYVVYPSIVALTKNHNPILFTDWAAIIKAVECHNSKEYQDCWNLAKDTTERNLQIVEGV